MKHRVHKGIDGQLKLLNHFAFCNYMYVRCTKSASMSDVTSDGKKGLRLIRRVN